MRAAAAQMVMDYWGPFVDQREVYNAARTWQGRRSGISLVQGSSRT